MEERLIETGKRISKQKEEIAKKNETLSKLQSVPMISETAHRLPREEKDIANRLYGYTKKYADKKQNLEEKYKEEVRNIKYLFNRENIVLFLLLIKI